MSRSVASIGGLLEAIVNHVALPARLPSKRESEIVQIETALTDRLLEASRALRDSAKGDLYYQWDDVRRTLLTCKALNLGGQLDKLALLREFRGLEHGNILILHVAEQNAGLLIRRHHGNHGQDVVFEAFEASPRSEDVLAAENALQWDFPGSAVAIPYYTFADDSFQDSLATFLQQCSTESIKRFAARTNKAGSSAFESRDTVDPAIISQMLTTMLEVHGNRVFPPQLRKRVRDDVCWSDGAEMPWRRSAHWLVMRVGIARHLSAIHGGEKGRIHYKFLLCLVLARLLDDSLQYLGPDLLSILRAKLSRRLAKLEFNKDKSAPSDQLVYDSTFAAFAPLFHNSLRRATERIEAIWNSFKSAAKRPMKPLPRRANQEHLELTLPNSGLRLQQTLAYGMVTNAPRFHAMKFDKPTVNPKLDAFAKRFFSISKHEEEIEDGRFAESLSLFNHERACVELSRKIDTYLNNVAAAYDRNPEQKSIMILTVMELWMWMDQRATGMFGLLMAYNPGIPPEALDVLQVPRFTDMRRLQAIQEYIRGRYSKSKSSRRSIFDDPSNGCFAERYFNESDDAEALEEVYQEIQNAAEEARQEKEDEWRCLSAEYEAIEKRIAEGACVYTQDDDSIAPIHDFRSCAKCYWRRKSRRMSIPIHEHPLPADLVQAKVVVFELRCPPAFAAYRNATWKILGSLAHPKLTDCREPRLSLDNYTQLKQFMDAPIRGGVSLASTTKSFLDTHYRGVRFPADLDSVCLPNGLKLRYHDSITKAWPGRQKGKPSFAHHCQITIPSNSSFSSLQFSSEFAADSDGPSSNMVISSQTKCPSGLNVHEYMAYQNLFSGRNRKWPSILIELGSSNLNFGSEATTVLIAQIASQAGPAHEDDPLRMIHLIFRDENFCGRLTEQISLRLDGISTNWRETNGMELLITMILRLVSLAPEARYSTQVNSSCPHPIELLKKARAFTYNWMCQLRCEIHKATDADASKRCSRYALWAALLCRRTFATHVEPIETGVFESLQPEPLQWFIESSITLQDNMDCDPDSLPFLLRQAIVRDLKMVHRIRYLLRQSLQASPDSLKTAINNIWPQPQGDKSRPYSEPVYLDAPFSWWVQMIVYGTHERKQQSVHYNLLAGHLLIDCKPLGRLPPEHRDSVILEELFGKRNLLTYPSNLYGMSYMLAVPANGHQVHIGFRNGNLFVRARTRDTVWERIPREIFVDGLNFDLPASLVDNCIHWLDLNTGILEIRQAPDKWHSKPSQWQLDVNSCTARRRNSSLVDPHSPVFHQIARIFDHFEYRSRITVYQPESGNLSVELRRLELTFHVNSRNLLWCKELRAEIDPNQDAGTWYGLASKLVLRDPLNKSQRSIIVPMGKLTYERSQTHVRVGMEPNGTYAKFTINDVLGRLDCPAEPWLLYLKAQLHAYTSYVVPDALTGRTGTEEALHCLKSGYCQPWTPLHIGPLNCLSSIARLTPKRQYYPQGMKAMQQVLWDPHLTTAIQNDEFMPIVRALYEKSAKLSLFAHTKPELPSLEDVGDGHLLQRSFARRRLYQRLNQDPDSSKEACDMTYEARDRCESTKSRLNVFESATLIRKWKPELPTTPDLAGILQSWPTIQGHGGLFDKFLLSDRLDVQFPLEWGSLVDFCRSARSSDIHRLTFLFSAMSFHSNVDMDVIRTLIAFIVLEPLKTLEPPKWTSYTDFRQNHVPSVDYLTKLMKPFRVPYAGDEPTSFNLSAKFRLKLKAAELAHEKQTENDCKELARFLLEQWPCPQPTLNGFSKPLLVDMSQALIIIQIEWLRLFQNMELSQYVRQVQQILDHHRSPSNIEPPETAVGDQIVFPTGYRGSEVPSLSRHLLRKSAPNISNSTVANGTHTDWKGPPRLIGMRAGSSAPRGKENVRTNPGKSVQRTITTSVVSREVRDLESIIKDIAHSKSTVRQLYGRDLMQSLNALKSLKGATTQKDNPILPIQLTVAITEARGKVQAQFKGISSALERDDPRAQWLKEGGMWPCITTISLLEQLRSTSTAVFGTGMKEAILEYAMSITALQQLLRIDEAQMKNNQQRLLEEQRNFGHENWQPLNQPDWLLLEIDANILIRPDQIDVAFATIYPATGSNSVLQMNMGQGKTSCIMPMVTAVLADTKKLLRVIVPKALLLQTAQLLQARIGGLLGREVRHVPFSRKTPTTPQITKAFWDIHKEIMESSGAMVTLPEHTMSFMLSGVQRLSDARISEATPMVKIQAWMRNVCRDVLDESDFTLAVRTQLIYPSGQQTTVDGHPHRWEIAEALLGLVEGHLWNLQQQFPRSIEIIRRQNGGFPLVFFLRKDVEDALVSRIINDILRGQTAILPAKECSLADRQAIRHFISEADVRPTLTERIQGMFPDKPIAKQTIYLLRGLLVHRILLLTLKKRWNVQYGLNPDRDPIAVPYHAKGVPSEQAEWGHPDVAILFTCLSFYFGGLDLAQLRQSLDHVVKSDDPSSEYDRWTQSANLPDSLREWNAINVDDESQLREIWQQLRHSVIVIDYFLNQFVFPRHAKQFRIKLQASGWDIPLLSPSQLADSKDDVSKYSKPLTTGFSGTNDNKTMLPLTIKQEDLPGLSHTSAEVLTYLLQPRNRNYVLAADSFGKHISELTLLQRLRDRRIRMLIDAGAQILEMDNFSLVKAWLRVDFEAKAALYFDAENRPFILYRNNTKIPLLASPFADDISECLVYLDEAHTRGTDLRMPTKAVGALTLGLGQTKDHTVQAAMRLRQLATTQSIVFFATPEVHHSILDQRKKNPGSNIDSYDVICWLLEQTCSGIEQLQPLYYSQGVDYCRRSQAAIDSPDLLLNPDQRETYLKEMRQTEHQTLEQLYKPKLKSKGTKTLGPFAPEIAAFMKELNTRRKGFQDLGNAVHGSALQEVEQEREVAHEVEAVREVQKPVHYKPLPFSGTHRDIVSFVKTGRLAASSAGHEHMFMALRHTALGLKCRVNSKAINSRLFISKEFPRTVELPCANDNFLRQVNWVLWSVETDTALVITPEEAEHLIPIVRKARRPHTHLLTYSAPVTRKMLQFNALDYFAIPALPAGWKAPAWLTVELGIFAGRLYFEFEEYYQMARYLHYRQSASKLSGNDEHVVSELSDVEAVPEDMTHMTEHQIQGFTAKPLTFLQEWLAIRRKGQDFTHTPMGYVCQGKPLTADHPFFSKVVNDMPAEAAPIKSKGTTGKQEKGAIAVDDIISDDSSDEDVFFDDVASDEEAWYDGSEYGSAVEDFSAGEDSSE